MVRKQKKDKRMLRELQTVLETEDNRLWHVAWSQDGNTLATCGSNRSCMLFRADREKRFHRVAVLEDAHSRTIRFCEFSPVLADGRLFLCTASFDATCVIWERKKSPRVITDEEAEAFMEEEEQWESIATLDGHENEVKSVSWSCDGTYLATCGRDKTCWVWELVQEEDSAEEWRCVSVLTGHEGDVKMVKFHPKRLMFASCSYDNSIRLWEYSDAEGDFVAVSVLNGHENTVWGCSFVTDNLLVSCSQDLTIKTWGRRQSSEEEEDVNDGEERWDLLFSVPSAHTRTIFSLDFLQNVNLLVTAGGDNAVCVRKVKIENGFVDENRAVKFSNAHEQDVNCVRFRPIQSTKDEATFATAGDDGKLKIWSVDLAAAEKMFGE